MKIGLYRRVLVFFALAMTVGMAHAEPEPEQPVPSPVTPPSPDAPPTLGTANCSLSGSTILSSSVKLYPEAPGDKPLARFTGATSQLLVVEFPSASSGRAKVETGIGSGSIRIAGYINAKRIPLFTSNDVPVYPPHLFIAGHRSVQFGGAKIGKLKIKKAVSYPLEQSFAAWAPCSALTMTQSPAPPWSPPGNAHGFIIKKPSIDLFDSYSRDRNQITTLVRADFGDGVLVWSTERKGGYAHILYHGDVIIDAWARTRDLKWLPPGETQDDIPQRMRKSRSVLKISGTPRVVKLTQDVKVLSAPKADAPVIGTAETETELYVVDVVAGFASVLPKSMELAPAGDTQFWVLASELPEDE